MSGGDAAPRPESRAGTRARIIDAAATLYSDRGETVTTVEEIAASAGVSPGSIYRHFGGKRELEEAMIDEALSRVESYLGEARRDASPIERVRGAGTAYFRVAVEFPVAMRFFAARTFRGDGAPLSQRFDASVTARAREIVITVAADLRQAMDVGEIPSGRVTDALLLLWGAWSGVIALMLRRDELRIDADTAARALDLGHHGLVLALAQARANPETAPPAARLRGAAWSRISPPPEPRSSWT